MTKEKFAKIAGGTALGTAVAGIPGMVTGLCLTLGAEAVGKIKDYIETNAIKDVAGDAQ